MKLANLTTGENAPRPSCRIPCDSVSRAPKPAHGPPTERDASALPTASPARATFLPEQCHRIQLLESEVIDAQGNGMSGLPSTLTTGGGSEEWPEFSGKSLGLAVAAAHQLQRFADGKAVLGPLSRGPRRENLIVRFARIRDARYVCTAPHHRERKLM